MTLLAFVACKQKGNPLAKVKQENVKKAMERNAKIKGAPIIKFDKKTYDFGVVYEGDTVKHQFKITNNGESNLIITRAKATCGCTVPTWPKEPIAPGQSDVLSVVFNTAGKSNKQTKSVTLTTNTENGSEVVSITGMVKKKTEEK